MKIAVRASYSIYFLFFAVSNRRYESIFFLDVYLRFPQQVHFEIIKFNARLEPLEAKKRVTEMNSFEDCVLMVCFVDWLLCKLEAVVFFSFYSGYLLLDSFIFIFA